MMNKYIRSGLLVMMIVFAAAILLFQEPRCAGHAVILQYHFFGDEHPPSTTVTLERFRRHLNIIKETGCRVWPLGRVAKHLRSGRELPDSCVAISIDDAYISVYNRALPILEEFGYPATLFIPTAAVDQRLPGYMSWEQIRKAEKRGIEPASHGHSHHYMLRRREGESDSEWERNVRDDIMTSLRRLGEELNTEVFMFAYPYGEYDIRLKKIVEELGVIAFGQQSGPAGKWSDFHALPRFPVSGPYSDPESFRIKIHSLPLPVESARPEDPLIPDSVQSPSLRLDLAEGAYSKSTLACFVSGQGRTDVEWVDRDEGILRVRAKSPLPVGRSRYNFTARHREMNRYFWYSHPWIRLE
ncbi:MAG: polysaccharide deacetylase family protein [Candidatus Latescibacteria bacterium]|nr:polysaccharide deacetylase family protein [bacterium]MBD3425508.1 polysaccharide deacetylase family protein [Candidatus Latescibacterota bacterium]